MIPHGGSGNGYDYHGCRCEECTEAHRLRVARRRDARRLEPKDPNDPRHGKVSFYRNHGCRCEECTVAHSAKCKAYQESRKASA